MKEGTETYAHVPVKFHLPFLKLLRAAKKNPEAGNELLFSWHACRLQLNFGRIWSFVKDLFAGGLFVSFVSPRLMGLYMNFIFLNKILDLPETPVIPSSVKRGKSD